MLEESMMKSMFLKVCFGEIFILFIYFLQGLTKNPLFMIILFIIVLSQVKNIKEKIKLKNGFLFFEGSFDFSRVSGISCL